MERLSRGDGRREIWLHVIDDFVHTGTETQFRGWTTPPSGRLWLWLFLCGFFSQMQNTYRRGLFRYY